ncbi:hypothetical protein OU5_P0164 (plasmid) [Pseudomonas mandelii JR-1]|uniref:Uncharacterized protein n=1 Tax=Pseudomonas mandelii JR-1 TaxID=1147786 RepID=A0A024ELC1_9PSED|nr:hypothetical protein OU5_P0164 [Pseudomonas mandelii JR-1]
MFAGPLLRVSQHTAQASTKALISTRRYLFNIGELLVSRATQMVDVKIDCGVRSALSQLYDVAPMPRRIFGNGLMTDRTQAVLLPPDAIHLRSSLRRFEHFLAPAELEILIPIGVVRIGSGLDRCAVRSAYPILSVRCTPLTVCGFIDSGEHPPARSSDFEISVLDPRGSFARMSSHRPEPEHCPDFAVYLIEDFLSDHVAMIVRPPS